MGFEPASEILSRYTVIDLTRARAGPTAARQLADWGANVIKIETPGQGGSGDLGARHGPDFQNLHRNKRSMTLDLKSPEGVEVFNKLAAQSAFFDDFSLDGPAPLVAASVVPEPASVVSLALGLVMLGLGSTRRLSRASA